MKIELVTSNMFTLSITELLPCNAIISSLVDLLKNGLCVYNIWQKKINSSGHLIVQHSPGFGMNGG